MNLETIRNLSEKRDGGLKKLASDIGMSEANLHRCIRNNKIQASDLERIAELLKVNISIFFDGKTEEVAKISNSAFANGNNSGASVLGDVTIGNSAVLSAQIKLLQQLLEEKERTIKILMNK